MIPTFFKCTDVPIGCEYYMIILKYVLRVLTANSYVRYYFYYEQLPIVTEVECPFSEL